MPRYKKINPEFKAKWLKALRSGRSQPSPRRHKPPTKKDAMGFTDEELDRLVLQRRQDFLNGCPRPCRTDITDLKALSNRYGRFISWVWDRSLNEFNEDPAIVLQGIRAVAAEALGAGRISQDPNQFLAEVEIQWQHRLSEDMNRT